MGTLFFAVAAASLGLLPGGDTAITEEVDLIEINHYYDGTGKLVIEQIIFYDWSPSDSRFQVRAWRMLKTADQMPRRDYRSGDYIARWHDGDILRQVIAPSVRETWTQHDPELVEREFLSKDSRRELAKLPTPERR